MTIDRLLRCVVLGAGGQAAVVAECIEASGVARLEGAIADGPGISGLKVLAADAGLSALVAGGITHFIAAIGDNAQRAAAFERAEAAGLKALSVIHPSAIVSPSARIGRGTVVMARAQIGAQAVVGANVIVNSGAIVEHHARIDDHAHLAPGAIVLGGAKAASLALIGAGAVVLQNVEIGREATLGAGAVAVRSVPDGEVATGVPARIRRD